MKKAMVIYHSQEYGNTEACARLLADGVKQAGDIEVTLVNTNETQRVDMQALADCDGVAFGSPDYGSYVAGTIKQIFDDIYMAKKSGIAPDGKPCVIFMTHGGGGKGVNALERLVKNYELIGAPFACRGKPEDGCKEVVELGERLGEAVLS